MAAIRHFHTKVAGVTKSNDDGTSRQTMITHCSPKEPLDLDHQENNPHDDNAVAVLRANGEQIGFLNSDLAKEVVRRSKAGVQYAAFVAEVTGGRGAKKNFGVNLLFIVADEGVSNDEIKKYIRDSKLGVNLKSGCLGMVGFLAVFSFSILFLFVGLLLDIELQ